jgi:DNA polymerase-3 subunit delta'
VRSVVETSESLVEPLGHGARLRELLASAARERLPHALLFTGPRGVGKFLAARWLACGLLCTQKSGAGPCGTCGGCRQFVAGNHLDVFAIDDDGERIRLKKIAYRPDHEEPEAVEAERFLATRAAAGGWRVVLVRDAERMLDEAQNAMLKMLEEPGSKALWILTTAQPQALLSTVRSRCIAVPFDALSPDDCATVLARHGVVAEEARSLALWARGSPGLALSLGARSAKELRAVLGAVLAGSVPPLDAARQLMEIEGEFTGSTPREIARDRARTVLDLALEVCADALRLAAGQEPSRLAHGDLVRALPPAARERSTLAFGRKVAALLETRADIDKNLDPQSLLDRACLTLAP